MDGRKPLVEVDNVLGDQNQQKQFVGITGDEMSVGMQPPLTSSVGATSSNENEENIPDKISLRKPRKSLLECFDPLYSNTVKDTTITERPHESNTSGQEYQIVNVPSDDSTPVANIIEEREEVSSILKDISNIVRGIVGKVSDITEITNEYPDPEVIEFEQKKEKMSEVLMNDEKENLQLKLNASQQTIATLELQLRQKEEVIIKLQAEAARREQSFKTEMMAMKEKYEAKEEECNNKDIKDMEEQLKEMKKRESKHVADIKRFNEVLSNYDKTYAKHVDEQKKLFEKHEIVKQHLAALEMAFSDLHQKYERAKTVINGFKRNEETLLNDRQEMEEMIKKSVEKYDTLKAHATAQVEKFNKDYALMCEKYEAENLKITTLNKRLEIKNASLVNTLEQKTEECIALTALCDELTGPV